MTSTSPGWYDDGHGAIRWWDGADWTEQVATPDPAQPGQQVWTPPAGASAAGGYPGSAAGGYPGNSAPGYPGYPTAGYPGAEAAPSAAATTTMTKPRTSKLWIVWVVLGVVVLGVVIALAALIPLVLQAFEPGSDTSVPPTSADMEAAASSVERYNDAWMSGDCEAYMATTTEDFREATEITNCDTFAVESRIFASGIDDYVTTIGDVEAIGNSIAVSATESYTSQFDAEGSRTDEPQEYEDRYEYIVVRSDGGWAIDNYYDD